MNNRSSLLARYNEVSGELRGSPHKWSIAIAHRAALRVLPFFGGIEDEDSRLLHQDEDLRTLITMFGVHSVLFSILFNSDDPEKKVAKEYFFYNGTTLSSGHGSRKSLSDADMATYFALGHAAYPEFYEDDIPDFFELCIGTAYQISGRTDDFLSNILHDFEYLRTDGVELLLEAPLWKYGIAPAQAINGFNNIKHVLEGRYDEKWNVWIEWYQDRLGGGKFDKGMERARLKIDETDTNIWNKTNIEINQMIADAIRNYQTKTLKKTGRQDSEKSKITISKIAEDTPLAETIELSDQGIFWPNFIPTRKIYLGNLKRLNSAVNSAIKANAFHENSEEILFLREILKNHSNDPQRIHDDCQLIYIELQELVEKNIIPNNLSVKRLKDAIRLTFVDIAANEPSVREVIENRKNFGIHTELVLSDGATELLKTLVSEIVKITSPELGSQLEQDIKSIAIDVGTLALGQAKSNAIYRLLSRLSRMHMKISSKGGSEMLPEAAKIALIHIQPHIETMLYTLQPFIT